MIQGVVKPLIPSTVKAVPSLRQFADGLRRTNPAIAMALERAQQALDVHDRALRSTPEQTDEFVFADSSGAVIAWLGSREGYWGGWFGQLYVGANGPADAPFFVDTNGVVSIGKNGFVQLLDPGENRVGWLGRAVDATKAITTATNADPVVVGVAAHGYENGDTVHIAGATGNTAINGYRIVKNGTLDTFEIAGLDGVDVAGNGAYAGAATCRRYFGGGLFETLAIGTSFPDYKLRAFADGSLRIKDALITLTDGDKIITLDPTGPLSKFQDGASEFTLTGTGGGTHRIDFSIEDAANPNLFTVGLNSRGEFKLRGYAHEASMDVLNYGRSSKLALRASGGTVAAPSALNGESGRIDFNAYNGTTPLGSAALAASWDGAASSLDVLIDDVVVVTVDAGGIVLPGLGASRPLKLDAGKAMVTGLIDAGSASDISASGFGANDLAQWDGTKFTPVSIASLAAALASYFAPLSHTHPFDATTSSAGDPAHTHSVSGETGPTS